MLLTTQQMCTVADGLKFHPYHVTDPTDLIVYDEPGPFTRPDRAWADGKNIVALDSIQ